MWSLDLIMWRDFWWLALLIAVAMGYALYKEQQERFPKAYEPTEARLGM
jgi:hypothetical protein